MSAPLVSIGLPVYNGEKSLRQAIDSVLAQDFQDFELVICDNASTDGTAAICREYADRDPRVRYVRNEQNIGASPNHDRVFKLSQGKYFAWMAADVEQLPGMLSRCVREMEQNCPPVILAYPQCKQVDENGNRFADDLPTIANRDPRPHRRLRTVVERIGYVTQHYGLFLAEALRKTRLNGSYASSDHVLTAEIAMLGEIREIPEVLLRRHHEARSGTQAVLNDKQAWAAWLDPRMKGRRFWLRIEDRLAWEYLCAALVLPLRPADKLRCAFWGPATHYRRYLPNTIRTIRSKPGIRVCDSWLRRLKHKLVG